MAVVLVTGMSGVGKSSLLAELARRGHASVDTDLDGWTIAVLGPDGTETDHVWDEDRIARLLAEDRSGHLFLGGCVSNQGRFYDRLDGVVLLSAPREVMLARIARRAAGFGRQPWQRDAILADLAAVEPLLRQSADAELDGTCPIEDLATEVEGLAARAGP